MSRLQKHLLVAAVLLASSITFSGCSSVVVPVAPTSGPATQATITPAQLAQDENRVNLAAALATKGCLVAMDSTDVTATAIAINQVDNAILAATVNNQLNLTQLRLLADKAAANVKGTGKQKLIVSQAVDSVFLVVQNRVNSDFNGLSDSDKLTATIRIVRAAAQGSADATTMFLTN